MQDLRLPIPGPIWASMGLSGSLSAPLFETVTFQLPLLCQVSGLLIPKICWWLLSAVVSFPILPSLGCLLLGLEPRETALCVASGCRWIEVNKCPPRGWRKPWVFQRASPGAWVTPAETGEGVALKLDLWPWTLQTPAAFVSQALWYFWGSHREQT